MDKKRITKEKLKIISIKTFINIRAGGDAPPAFLLKLLWSGGVKLWYNETNVD